MGRSFAVLLLLVCAVPAKAASFRVGAPGRWVDRLALPTDGPLAVPRPLEWRTLLSDHQINFGVHSVERYARWATRIDDEASLQSASQLRIAFDPSYQSVVLHSVVIVRNGARLNRLYPEKIKQAQREPNLEAQMYDGRQTLILFLEDLRIGDVLDVEYTISGADPTLAGHVSEMLFLGTPMPVERLRARVLVPTGKRFRFVASGPGAEGLRARAKPTPFGDEYVWDRVGVPAYPIEAKLPSWYEPLPMVQLTDFESWAAVARWAEALMLRPAAPSAAVVDEARALRERSSSNLAFAQAATRFVQDEIRYVAVETGLSRRKPTAPELVLKRRFGDCKDKSLLLASLLRAGGIDSEPALVSTTWRDHLDALLPSANVFDHAIVHVRAGPVGTSDLWIDPTIALAGGGLERAVGSTLGRALVLSGSAESLATIPRERITEPQASIRDRYQIPEAGSQEPARLDVEREFHGNMADGLRATLRRGTRSEMAKSYLQLYARQFPSISSAGEVEVLDERDRDRLLITAHFTIRDPWKRSEARKRWELEVAPTLIDAYFEKTDAAGRTAPLATPHPAVVHCSIELTMASAWSVKREQRSAAGPAFDLVFSSRGDGRTVGYEYSFASLADHVDVAELAHHGVAVDEARRLLTRSLSWRPLEPGANPWAWIAMAVTAIACLTAGPRAYRYLASPAATEHGALVPMSGWLTLLGLRLCATPLALVNSFRRCAWLFRRSGWARFVDPTYATYHPSVAVFGLVELMAELAIGFYLVFLIACFFQRRRSFALHLTIFTIAGAILAIIDAAGSHLLGTGVEVLVRAAVIQIVVGVAFLLYVHRSDAAHRVFVR